MLLSDSWFSEFKSLLKQESDFLKVSAAERSVLCWRKTDTHTHARARFLPSVEGVRRELVLHWPCVVILLHLSITSISLSRNHHELPHQNSLYHRNMATGSWQVVCFLCAHVTWQLAQARRRLQEASIIHSRVPRFELTSYKTDAILMWYWSSRSFIPTSLNPLTAKEDFDIINLVKCV